MSGNNQNARDAWNANARFWDEHMGEGNDFLNVLVWPAAERLLSIHVGERILDIACGNGLTSRRLWKLGAKVVAIDFSEILVGIARERKYGRDIDYRIAQYQQPSG
jgi:2-polyprenyl-3-methyl-5-hydroxy-6-metoxy-1,4-benzoquinol methylase